MSASLPVHILASQHEAAYLAAVRKDLVQAFEKLEDSLLSVKAFSFYASVSAVFSSRIEGEPIELDSYVRYKRFGAHYLPTIPGKRTTCTMHISLPGDIRSPKHICTRRIKASRPMYLLPAAAVNTAGAICT